MSFTLNVPAILHTSLIHATPQGGLSGVSLHEQLGELDAEKADISQSITNGVTDKSPSEDAVYDALAGKAPAGFGLGTYSTVVTGDLNDIKTTGFYYAESVAQNNKPVSVNGYLLVEAIHPSYVTQKFVQAVSGDCYLRNCDAGTWSAWKQLATTDSPVFTGSTQFSNVGNPGIKLLATSSINLGSDQAGGSRILYSSNGYTTFIPRDSYGFSFTKGNVGIGVGEVNLPVAALHVNGPSSPSILLTHGTGLSTDPSAYLRVVGDSYGEVGAYQNGVGGKPLAINPLGGNVGIGTTSPQATLHSMGSTLLGSSAVPTWNLYNNQNISFYSNESSLSVSWRSATGICYQAVITGTQI